MTCVDCGVGFSVAAATAERGEAMAGAVAKGGEVSARRRSE